MFRHSVSGKSGSLLSDALRGKELGGFLTKMHVSSRKIFFFQVEEFLFEFSYATFL